MDHGRKLMLWFNRRKRIPNYSYFISYCLSGDLASIENAVFVSKDLILSTDDITFIQNLVQRTKNTDKPVTIVSITLLGQVDEKEKG